MDVWNKLAVFGFTTLTAVAAHAAPAIPVATVGGASSSTSDVEMRGVEELNRGNYSAALPMLQRVASQLQGQPDRLSTIEEDIRVCQRNLALSTSSNTVLASADISPGRPAPLASTDAPATQPAAASANSNGLVPGGLGGTMRTPHPKPTPGVVQEMQIKDLGNFDYDAEKGGNLPADVLAMDGSQIRLPGFMIPMDQAESITRFALVPSLFSCCYGQPPQIQHTIVVNIPKGKAVNYYPDQIIVQGTLHVREKKEDGFIVSIFDIDTSSVKPAPK
jgi:hypothetical protein